MFYKPNDPETLRLGENRTTVTLDKNGNSRAQGKIAPDEEILNAVPILLNPQLSKKKQENQNTQTKPKIHPPLEFAQIDFLPFFSPECISDGDAEVLSVQQMQLN